MTHTASRLLLGCAALATAAGVTLSPVPARAGVFIAFPPVVFGAPAAPYPPPYYYPPAYYPSPYYGYPAYAPPPAPPPPPQMSRTDTPYGARCFAGNYTCAAPAQTYVGTECSCPGIGAPSYGSVQ